MTNYEPMWAVVDGLRQVSDSLENWTREQTGDRSVPEVDKIDAYQTVFNSLTDAALMLETMSDRVGHQVTRAYASRCAVFAKQCRQAAKTLDAVGEL